MFLLTYHWTGGIPLGMRGDGVIRCDSLDDVARRLDNMAGSARAMGSPVDVLVERVDHPTVIDPPVRRKLPDALVKSIIAGEPILARRADGEGYVAAIIEWKA